MSAPNAGHSPGPPQSIKVISHTGLLYWWPVWLTGFILGGLTWVEDARLAIVPAGTTVQEIQPGPVYQLTVSGKPSADLVQAAAASAQGQEAFPVRTTRYRSYGIIYLSVLLLVTYGANVPFRGLASIIAVLFIVVVAMVFVYLDWWAQIFAYLNGLHIEISVAGYLFPSVVLLVLWLGTFFLYDPLRYMTFTPGQFILHKEIGDMQQVFDTSQVEVEKRRTDLFRYWILGFGAGDLVIKVPSQALEIELPNVLFVAQRVNQIANLMKTKPVVNE